MPPNWLYLLDCHTTGMVLPQLVLLGLRGGDAPAERAQLPFQATQAIATETLHRDEPHEIFQAHLKPPMGALKPPAVRPVREAVRRGVACRPVDAVEELQVSPSI